MNKENKLALIKIKTRRLTMIISLAALTSSCMVVGPDYKRPEMKVPEKFKTESMQIQDQVSGNDQKAIPLDSKISWWTIYNDDVLNSLEQQIELKNYSVQAALAQLKQAKSSADIARAGKSPALVAGGINDIGILLSWEVDLWGRIKRETESGDAIAQASMADLASATLSLQAQLAQNYFLLRIQDADIQLLEKTMNGYRRSLEISQNQYAAGVVGRENLTQAQAQLSGVEVQFYKDQITRAQLEHSIAVLVGSAPADFEILPTQLNLAIPSVPQSLPSQLLSRRPDIAAAERRMAAANAQIGAAKARAYPSLSVSSGYRLIKNLVGGSKLVAPIYTGGAISANQAKASAGYQATVANYKQAVLTSFQEVEDNLVELKLLDKASQAQAKAVTATEKSVEILNNQYKAGIVNYQSIVIVQASSLENQRSALNILSRQLNTSVALIKALGGGWSVEELENKEAGSKEQD